MKETSRLITNMEPKEAFVVGSGNEISHFDHMGKFVSESEDRDHSPLANAMIPMSSKAVKETPPKQPSHNKLDNVEGEDWVVLE
jgi:hypothetical protein